jgi:REP element-mobilizing transposase RayT
MAGTFTFLGIHFVFSTKNRIPLIDEKINVRLYAYIGGIIRELGGTLLEINAVPDHIHFYVYMPKTISVMIFYHPFGADRFFIIYSQGVLPPAILSLPFGYKDCLNQVVYHIGYGHENRINKMEISTQI